MGRSTTYNVEITFEGELSPGGEARIKALLENETEFDEVGVWYQKDAKTFVITSEEEVGGDYNDFGRDQTKIIFRLLGICEVNWAWYYQEREPDDSDSF